MSSLLKHNLALAAACLAATIAGCSGSSPSAPELSNAKISVSTEATQSQINHITLTISQGPVVNASNQAMASIVVELTKAPAQNQWLGSITNIPSGSGRLFHADAYKAAGNAAADLIYAGETVATITAGGTASVTLILQEQNVAPGPTRIAPQITALTVDNAYVLPSTVVAIHAAAVDQDHQGDPLTYSWSVVCDNGVGSFSPANTASTSFLAPAVNATCQLALLVKETASASNLNTPLSVTTYFTVTVNGNFGRANVAAFPNSAPIVTIKGDFRYNYFADVTSMPVGQAGDFNFSAIDNDGDNVRYSLAAKCGASLAVAAGQPNLSGDYFYYLNGATVVGKVNSTDGSSFTTTASTGVSPPLAYTSTWFPHFGVAPGFVYSNPADDCIFTVTVQDLCTAGNCGAAGQGGLADGADKQTTIGGVVVKVPAVGIINALHPAKPQRAPVVEASLSPNQDGPAATGVQTWDPQKKSFVLPSSTYNFSASADDRYEGGTTTAVWSCNTGTVSAPVVTHNASQPGQTTSAIVLTTGASVPPNGQCTATFTSSASGLSTPVNFFFLVKDQCSVNGWNAGQACSTGNACITGETCNASFVCSGGAAVTCSVTDGQCQTPVCDPALGCGMNNVANNTACNKDSNGCTGNDSCQAGVCTAGAAVVCNTPADAQCQSSSGSCVSTGNNTHSCTYSTFADTTSCNFDNNGCTQNDHCSSGACVAGAAVTCSQSANPCQSASGTCVSTGANSNTCQFTNSLNGSSCNVAGTCVAGQTCQAGACQGGSAACPANDSCTPTTPTATCTPSDVVAVTSVDVQVTPPSAGAIDSAGATYLTAPFYSLSPVNFGSIPLVSTGDADIVIAKYNAAGVIQWAFDIGDDVAGAGNPQIPVGAAVTQNGKVAIIGNFSGQMTFGATSISTASTNDFLAFLDSGTGATLTAKQFNDGSNGALVSVAANPGSVLNRVAVCGRSNVAATGFVGAGTVYAGGTSDAIVGAFDTSGNKLWALELGNGAYYENCQAVAVDDNGDVFAAGQFDSAALVFTGASSNITLTGPAAAALKKFVWVAKFNGATGKVLAAVALSTNLGQAGVTSLITDSVGNVVVGGIFGNTLNVGATLLTSAGGNDGFIAKLDGTALAPVWSAVRIGSSGADSLNSVAVTSYGDIVATGLFNGTTTGLAALTSAGASDAFVVKVNGQTGTLDFAHRYGDGSSQNGDAALINRYGVAPNTNQISLLGTFAGAINFGGATGSITAATTDAYFVTAKLQ